MEKENHRFSGSEDQELKSIVFILVENFNEMAYKLRFISSNDFNLVN
jgi:hypothetical protein